MVYTDRITDDFGEQFRSQGAANGQSIGTPSDPLPLTPMGSKQWLDVVTAVKVVETKEATPFRLSSVGRANDC